MKSIIVDKDTGRTRAVPAGDVAAWQLLGWAPVCDEPADLIESPTPERHTIRVQVICHCHHTGDRLPTCPADSYVTLPADIELWSLTDLASLAERAAKTLQAERLEWIVTTENDRRSATGQLVTVRINGYAKNGYRLQHSADVKLDRIPASALAVLMRQTPFELTVRHQVGPRSDNARPTQSIFEQTLRRLRDRLDNLLDDGATS